jgi:hypothetical protein
MPVAEEEQGAGPMQPKKGVTGIFTLQAESSAWKVAAWPREPPESMS